jgi:HlyD family secretion protein
MTESTDSSSIQQEPKLYPPHSKSQHRKVGFIILILLIVLGFCLWRYLERPRIRPLMLSGRLEGYENNLGAKIGGRVDYVAVREGAEVKAGQLLVNIYDADLQAQLAGAQANIAAVKQQENQAVLQLDAIQNQSRQAVYSLKQAGGTSGGQIQQAQSTVQSAQSLAQQSQGAVEQAQQDYDLAEVDFTRYCKLLPSGAVSRQVYDQGVTRYKDALSTLTQRKAALQSSLWQVEATKGLLTQAIASGFTPAIRKEQVRLLQIQLMQAKSQLEAVRSNVLEAKANIESTAAQISYMHVHSPVNGIVTARIVEPGDIVGPGNALLILINLDEVYLRGYIPEESIGRVRVGQQANIYLDSSPNAPVPSSVCEIDTEASFTPENIYFRNDRAKQVFGVKLCIHNPEGFAKPGMPADAEILTDDYLGSLRKEHHHGRNT